MKASTGGIMQTKTEEVIEIFKELMHLVSSLDAEETKQTEKAMKALDELSPEKKKILEETKAVRFILDFLRLRLKYVLFDLEATKRENKFLSNLLSKKEEP
jgi:hypothetical protein